MSRIRRRAGFTVLELVLVLAVIVVLAAIAMPILLGAQRQARETKLRATLTELRSAVQRYGADCGGSPWQLDDISAVEPPRWSLSYLDGSRQPVARDDFQGPYLLTPNGELPEDPITGAADWRYTRSSGRVRSNARGRGLDGTRYRDW